MYVLVIAFDVHPAALVQPATGTTGAGCTRAFFSLSQIKSLGAGL